MNQAPNTSPLPQPGSRREPVLTRASGVTLIELTMTMAIVAVLMAVAIPSFQYVTNANRMASEVNALLGDMQFARGEAIKQGLTVIVCTSSSDQKSCSGTSANWQSGWIVYVDTNNNGSFDSGEPVVRVAKAFKGTDTFTDKANSTQSVSFNREGFAPAVPGGVLTINLNDSTSNSKWTRCVKINTVGMLMTTTYSTATTPAWPGACQ
jgi:type IV fimbrial biogenesis protein FimT